MSSSRIAEELLNRKLSLLFREKMQSDCRTLYEEEQLLALREFPKYKAYCYRAASELDRLTIVLSEVPFSRDAVESLLISLMLTEERVTEKFIFIDKFASDAAFLAKREGFIRNLMEDMGMSGAAIDDAMAPIQATPQPLIPLSQKRVCRSQAPSLMPIQELSDEDNSDDESLRVVVNLTASTDVSPASSESSPRSGKFLGR